jgi:hypothetical protein
MGVSTDGGADVRDRAQAHVLAPIRLASAMVNLTLSAVAGGRPFGSPA